MKYGTPYRYPFLSLETKFSLHYHIESELDAGKYPSKGGIPLLTYATKYPVNHRSSVYPLSSPDLVQAPLEKGEDANQIYKDLANNDVTPCLQVLKHLRDANREGWIEQKDNQRL